LSHIDAAKRARFQLDNGLTELSGHVDASVYQIVRTICGRYRSGITEAALKKTINELSEVQS
jgi:hypothetical protein